MEHNLKIDWKTGKMEWLESRKTPNWTKIRQKSNENHTKKTIMISTTETMKKYIPDWMKIRQKSDENQRNLAKETMKQDTAKRYTPNWTAIRQKMLENIERIKAKGKRKQDNPEPTKP